VGSLRFENPQAWDEAYPAAGRQATSYGKFCPQLATLIGAGDEDCLFLNVWRPAKESLVALPAMVWIHGGSFILGASSSASPPAPTGINLYDGCGFASDESIIIASMNYRLGPLGFTNFEEDGEIKGNFGLKDQRQALFWLQQELQAFGGDPSKVTIFGESAGAISVYWHVASPASRGLFRAAISESGWPDAWGWEYSRNVTVAFAAKAGCTDASTLRGCLRTKTTKELIDNAGEVSNPFATAGWWPSVTGGEEMPQYPHTLFKQGKTNSVAMLVGTNSDEGNLFVWPLHPLGMNETQYERSVKQMFNGRDPVAKLTDDEYDQLFDLYAGTAKDAEDKRPLAGQLMTDGSFVCANYAAMQKSANRAWVYRFDHRMGCNFILPELPGVVHGAELPLIWGAEAKMACIWTFPELALSKRMRRMWASFATHLDPTAGEGGWPLYTDASRKALVLQTKTDAVEEDNRGQVCKFWEDTLFSKFDKQSGAPASLPTEIAV